MHLCEGPYIPADAVLTAKGVSTESALVSPLELVADTTTLYSALGINPRRVTLVPVV